MNVRKWLRSFRFAYEGILYALRSQQNMRFHFAVSFLVLVLAMLFNLSKLEILFILLAVTLVLVTELINTAVESAVDLAMPERHPLAKIAKDVAAASVLISSVFAAAVGMIVFFEPLDRLYRHVQQQGEQWEPGGFWVLISLVFLTVIVLHTRFSQKQFFWRPSLISAFAFSVSTIIAMYAGDSFPALLAYLLAATVALLLYDKTARSFTSIMLGACVGGFVSFCLYYYF